MAEPIIKHFHSKIVGVSHENDDGTSRQRIISKCMPLERLSLYHDENNRYDENAIRVLRNNGEQLGFLSRELAEEIVRKSKQGQRFGVFIKNLTGGTRTEPTRGVNILIVEASPEATAAQTQAYVDTIDMSDADELVDDYEESEGSSGGGRTAVFSLLIFITVAIAAYFYAW